MCPCRSTNACSLQPGSKERAKIESALGEMAGADPIELTATIDGVSKPASGEPFDVTMPSDHSHILGTGQRDPEADATEAIDAALAAAPDGQSWASSSGQRFSCEPPTCSPALAGHLERSHDARSGQDRAAGRNRRGLRADRLLAVQCRLRAGTSSKISRSHHPESGTGPTTARSRASCTPSPRSTSPRLRATCQPHRR